MATTGSAKFHKFIASNEGTKEEVLYTLRGLSEDEVISWTEFCAGVFAYKANPPPSSYFLRHYENDPDRSASLIRVAFDPQGTLVGSCRIFRRQISTSGENSLAGGIGEVCTHESHRRRGLSKALMADCLDIMTQEGFKLSLLHAAPTFFPVYEASGFSCSLCQWSTVHIGELQRPNLGSLSIRRAKFPEDTAMLKRMYERISERNFTTIVRSESYWNEYVHHELGSSLFLLIQEGQILGSLALKVKNGMVIVAECSWETSLTSAGLVMSQLLPPCLEHSSIAGDFELKLPTFLLEKIDWIDSMDANEANDLGWMFKELNDGCKGTAPFLIWPTDSF